LQDLFDLDVYLALGGRDRSEATEKEVRLYWRACDRFISRRTGQPRLIAGLETILRWFARFR
jgi:hypothetical protein